MLKKNRSLRIKFNKRTIDRRKIIRMLNSWSRNIIEKTKRNIFNTMIESVLLYGAEQWRFKSANEKKKTVYKTGLLAKIPQQERKATVEIRAKDNHIKTIDKKRLQWYEHFQHVNMSSMPLLIINWRPERKTKGEDRGNDGKRNCLGTLWKMEYMRKILRTKRDEGKN